MAKDQSLQKFYTEFMQEVNFASEIETSGWTTEDFFTSTMLEYLEEAGEAESPIICPYRAPGLQLNAYSFSEDFSSLDIFVSIFSSSEEPKQIPQAEVDSAIKRTVQLFHKAVSDLHKSFHKDNETYEFAMSLKQNQSSIENVNVCALTNGLVKPAILNSIAIGNATISFRFWDIDRLYRCVTSGKMRETIEIDFEEKFGVTIPCIENITSDKYKVYLAIIDGYLLAELYNEHRDRLLEKNVRSYLQARGSVNKGIRDTLRSEPDMFLAYNNGISVTAEQVTIVRDENGRPSIKGIRDLQIVNGGQTTASIYNASKDNKNPVDMRLVHVQMKISVIDSPDDADEIVPRISTYANTQNRIQMADFSANDPFHRRIEELSRTIWTPTIGGNKPLNWFYERARGQYTDMLAKESTVAKKREYKLTHPLFSKTDLAKYENTWDQLPHIVSEGAQKSFRKFMVRLADRKLPLPDATYYQRLIAKAILFKQTERLVQQQQFGGYRANIVAYTLAYLSYKTAQRIDLERIWKEQGLSGPLKDELVRLSGIIQQLITNPPGGANVGEWCKREKCWDMVKELDQEISTELFDELVSISRPGFQARKSVASIDSITDEEQKQIEKAEAVPASIWFSISRWAKETGNLLPWQRSLLFSMGTIAGKGKTPTVKQSIQALKAFEEAKSKGFSI